MGEPKPLTAYQQTYHWRNKNCGPWAQEWIKKTLPGLKVEQGESYAEIVEVTQATGDCDLGQRKGKLLTIYDLEVVATWKGKVGDEEVKGKVTVPEVSHEAIDGLSDYQYQFSLTSDSSSSAEALLSLVKKQFPDILSNQFNQLRPALLAAHGGPQEGVSPGGSGASTPAYSPAPPGEPRSQKPAPSVKKEEEKGSKVDLSGTKTVEVEAELQASADDLWGLLTEEGKIPMWSRSAAQIKLDVGSSYSLFGGNVTGQIKEVKRPELLVQSWQTKSPGWPREHFGTMTMSLKQGESSTKAKFKLDGVPAGLEADIEKAIDGFYVRGLKSMGLGTML